MISKRVSLQTFALAIVLISFNVGSVTAYDPYYTPDPSPPPPLYEYMSPPPPSPSPPPPSNSYYYNSPPPPSSSPPPITSPPPPSDPSPPPPITSPPPPPSPHRLIVRVVGKVYCYRCYDWKIGLENSHNKKPLLGATVEVACKAERKTIKAYGKTKSNGQYIIKVEDFEYLKYGPTVCEAKLHAPPKGSSCNIPTDLCEETDLKVIYQDKYEVVLEAKPFAYAKNEPYEECQKSPPPYPYISPPPPYGPYISPPTPSPSPPPPSPSPSPPPPSPSPPPPPSPSPPIYPYISPPPPPSPSPPPYHNK